MSRYCNDIAHQHDIKVGGVNKLVPNLGNKRKFVLHYRSFHLSFGLKLIGIKQTDWLKKCIDFNTDKRKNAVNSFEKDFFKSMNNSVYGKRMENLRKKVKFKLVNNDNDYKK